MSNELRNFLALTYEELEELNLKAKEQRKKRTPFGKIQEERLKYLTDEKRIKAVTVLFSDLEGRLHMLDYDKKFLVKSYDNLTFDGSSIRGFTAQRESDLRLGMDWGFILLGAVRRLRPGKVLVFGEVIDKDGTVYSGDIRGVLKGYADALHKKKATRSTRPTKLKASCSRAPTPSARITRPASSSMSTPAATIIRCLAIRCALSSTPPPKCSAPWVSRTRRTTPKLRPRSLKSTTATPKWWPRPTRSSSTN
jgi:hypothetical protein